MLESGCEAVITNGSWFRKKELLLRKGGGEVVITGG